MEICVPLPEELAALSHLSHLYMQNDLGTSGTHYLFPGKKGVCVFFKSDVMVWCRGVLTFPAKNSWACDERL